MRREDGWKRTRATEKAAGLTSWINYLSTDLCICTKISLDNIGPNINGSMHLFTELLD